MQEENDYLLATVCSRAKTEDFLTFLCLRSKLTVSLHFGLSRKKKQTENVYLHIGSLEEREMLGLTL